MTDFSIPSPSAPSAAFQTRSKSAEGSAADDVSQNFEAVFLGQFVDEMMKTSGSTAFGGKQQAEMWRSFMSNAIAESLVDQGGFGFGGNVKQVLAAYGKGAETQGDTPIGLE